MRDMETVNNEHLSNMDDVCKWCDDLYSEMFAPYFEFSCKLFDRLKSEKRTIADSELEDILTLVPLELISVCEMLNNLSIRNEVLKASIKLKENTVYETDTSSTITRRKEVAALSVVEDKLLHDAYSSVIARVERQISYSRELIMSAKKIWDARRQSENPPVGEAVDTSDNSIDLPEYTPQPKSGIYGR